MPIEEQKPVVVKPLEWVTVEEGQRAITVCGMYAISPKGNKLTLTGMPGNLLGRFKDIDAAKAAAQADYEKRIRSALVHPTPTVADTSDALGYATRLLISLMEKHCPDRSPQWEPLPDLIGVLTQLDNLSTCLTRKPVPVTADTGLVERLKKAEYWQEHYRNSAEMLRMDLAAAREQIEELKATINQMYVDVQAARDAAFTPEVTDGQ